MKKRTIFFSNLLLLQTLLVNTPAVYSDTHTKTLKFIDTTSPVIIQNNSIEIIQGNSFNIFDYINVIDNDKVTVVIKNNNLDTNVVGTYYVTVIANDQSYNSVQEDIKVTVVSLDDYLEKEEMVRSNERLRISQIEQEKILEAKRQRDLKIAEIRENFTGDVSQDLLSFTQAYLGMKGQCTEVAQKFLSDFFGVPVNIFGGYEVSTSEARPGDILYYYRSSVGTQHYAVYLGGELALHGNYNGTTVVASMFTPGSCVPKFYRVR